MFAYCNNNPANLRDTCGYLPEYTGDPNYEWAWRLGWLLKEKKEEQEEADRNSILSGTVVYEQTDQGAKIRNSYKIKSIKVMYEFIADNRGSEIHGTTTGVVFEWRIHNFLYNSCEKVGWDKFKENLAHTDVGSTVFADRHSGIMVIFSLGMQFLYVAISPATAAYDLSVETGRWDLFYGE